MNRTHATLTDRNGDPLPVDVHGVALDGEGVPLWDLQEWGTRGPPWRARLARGDLQVPSPTRSAGAFTGLPAPATGTMERGHSRDTIARVEKRILDTTPGCTPDKAKQLAREAAIRYDRRGGNTTRRG